MKKFIFLLTLTGLVSFGYGQVVNPGDVAKTDANNRVNNNISNEVDKGLGKTESAVKGLFKKKKKTSDTVEAAQVVQTPVVAPATTAAQQQTPVTSFKAYNNYDFIPGDQIVFFDNFADDDNGEFPAHWHLGNGQAVMNKTGDVKSLLITDGNYAHVSPLIKSASYLSDPFTIEFDSYTTGGYQPHIYFYNTNADATAATSDLGHVTFNGWGGIEFVSAAANIDLTGNLPAEIAGENYLNKWHHVAIAFKKGQIKVYVDQYRILVVPNTGISPHAIDIEGIGDANTPIIIANFRMANGGGMNMLGKKFTDAKIITHGINFDIDKATIRPESMGTLNMVAGVLKENPDVKFEIDGHTDNSGTSPHNLTLSQQRADAVKAQLMAMGIDASRLSTKGFGDSKPISDNTTPEGKANNRRVEFVKL